MNASSLSGLWASDIFIGAHPGQARRTAARRGPASAAAPTRTAAGSRPRSRRRAPGGTARARRALRRDGGRAVGRGTVHHHHVRGRDAGRRRRLPPLGGEPGMGDEHLQVRTRDGHDRRSLHDDERPRRPGGPSPPPRPAGPPTARAIAHTTREAPASPEPRGVGAGLAPARRRPPRSGTARRCRTRRRSCRAGSARTRLPWS